MGALLRHGVGAKPIDLDRMAASLVCAGSFVFVCALHGYTVEAVELAIFAAILVRISSIDFDRRVIPDALLVVAAAVRLAYLGFAWCCGLASGQDVAFYAISALVVGLVLVVSVVVADFLFDAESMGGGDVKLYAVSAWYFGWDKALLVVMLSCLFGIVAALASRRRGDEAESGGFMKRTLPFGPAIALACFAVMVLGGAQFDGVPAGSSFFA